MSEVYVNQSGELYKIFYLKSCIAHIHVDGVRMEEIGTRLSSFSVITEDNYLLEFKPENIFR